MDYQSLFLPKNFMKSTPFEHIHVELGAKMAEFAGYNMPISYSGIQDEHHAVRNSVGVFDVSHMGEFIVKGKGAYELVQKVTSNDISTLTPGKAQYSCLPNNAGGIVDDLIVYLLEEGVYMLVVNASNMKKDWEWIVAHNTEFGATVENISDRTALLAVQGPKAIDTIQKLTDTKVADIPFYGFERGKIGNCDNVIFSGTGYTGSGGFELYFDEKHATEIWNAVFEAGKEFDIKPAGLGARDTLRLEMGYCLYGNDINDETSPLEAGLGWITKFKDGNDFINRKELEEQKATGVFQKLVGFEMVDKGIPRHGYDIVDESGQKIGEVTSGSTSPSTGKYIGLGYVRKDVSKSGSEIYIQIRKKQVKAEVTKLPFYKAQ